jgi:fibronectin-binding autotransporter adhesin
VAGGTLRFGNSNGPFALQQAASVTVDAGATLDYTGFGGTIRSLLGAGTVVNPANLQLQFDNSIFAGTITGAGGLTLLAATATLTGPNTYTGGTNIATFGGVHSTLTLAMGGSIVGSVANSGNLVIGSGGTLNLSGAGLASADPAS